MSQRWVLALYASALALPWLLLAVASASDIAHWLKTGFCPGGPMDRAAGPCGPAEFFFIVFLGGWVSFVLVPLLALWSAGVTAGFLLHRARKRRRSAAAPNAGRLDGDASHGR